MKKSAGYLQNKGSDSPRLDAEILLCHVLGLQRLDLYLQFDRPLSEEEKSEYRQLLSCRGDREPVAYITGEKEFMSLSFHVTPEVLIPRPDTEVLVEESVRLIEEWKKAKKVLPSVFEIGSGSGAISISLLHHFPDLEITASDISDAALSITRKNAERHHVLDRLQLMQGDLFAGAEGPFDMILSNPPYIAESERESLSPEITKYEPGEALFAGKEGLDIIFRILDEGEKKVSPGGWILVEIAPGQIKKLKSKIEADQKFSSSTEIHDYAGRVRVLRIKK